ncbi:MAG: glycosyltransferase family 2 protein [Solirubrobacterales bacterium]
MSGPRISVCICTRNRPSELVGCLASIRASRYPVGQVIVSDDGDDARARAVCEEAGEIAYLRGPKRGLCANRNNALAAVAGTHVLFLDDDARLAPDFLEFALAKIAAAVDGDRVIVTGREQRPNGHETAAREQSFLGFQEVSYDEHSELRTVVINAALFPAALFDAIEFDEKIRYGYDEVDLTTRAVALGYRIVSAPQAVNLHRKSEDARDGYDAEVDASRLYVTFKRYASTDRSRLRALGFAVAAPLHLLAAAVKSAGPRGVPRALSVLRVSAARTLAANR